MKNMSKKSICIVGAGLAGLISCKNFISSGYKVTIFEQYHEIGGTWVVRDKKNGSHTSMYPNMKTNLPNFVMALNNHPYPDKTPLFFSPKEQIEYINHLCKKFNLLSKIIFNSKVIKISKINGKNLHNVHVLNNGIFKNWEFDFICVCNGHYFEPYIPQIKGIKSFTGKFIHSKYYADINYEKMRNHKVIVMGSGSSARDITYYITKKNILVYQSTNNNKIKGLNDHVKIKPRIKVIKENDVYFEDHTVCNPDLIICATGYQYSFPFIDNIDIGKEGLSVRGLYKHMLLIKDPSIAIIGVPKQIIPSWVFDFQSKWISGVWGNKITLPSKENMERELNREERELYLDSGNENLSRKRHYLGDKMFGYMNSLGEECRNKNMIIRQYLIDGYRNSKNMRLKIYGY